MSARHRDRGGSSKIQQGVNRGVCPGSPAFSQVKKVKVSGSPPPARRAPATPTSNRRVRRFTSARVESTARPGAAARRCPVHLRLRGEHTRPRMAPPTPTGSPPPARRTPSCPHPEACRRRFTSARAENTIRRASWCGSSTVHLRPRGEHPIHHPPTVMPHGSPPPARRTHPAQQTPAGHGRFTSARAENTRSARRGGPRPAVHLRPRGEHAGVSPGVHRCGGSPPPARRTPSPSKDQAGPGRFTSARAENTLTRRCALPRVPVHLRPRGEHVWRQEDHEADSGSPPPARRTRQLRLAHLGTPRFTSARAENTGTGRRRRRW